MLGMCGVSTPPVLSQGIPPAACLDFRVCVESFWEQERPWVLFAQALLVVPDPKGSGPGSHIVTV